MPVNRIGLISSPIEARGHIEPIARRPGDPIHPAGLALVGSSPAFPWLASGSVPQEPPQPQTPAPQKQAVASADSRADAFNKLTNDLLGRFEQNWRQVFGGEGDMFPHADEGDR